MTAMTKEQAAAAIAHTEPRITLKLFMEFGLDGLKKLETRVNDWLDETIDEGENEGLRVKILRSSIQLSSISSCPSEEFYQCMVCEIWWHWIAK